MPDDAVVNNLKFLNTGLTPVIVVNALVNNSLRLNCFHLFAKWIINNELKKYFHKFTGKCKINGNKHLFLDRIPSFRIHDACT